MRIEQNDGRADAQVDQHLIAEKSVPISVFLVSDFLLLLDALKLGLSAHPDRYALVGHAPLLRSETPWLEARPDVLLLDMEMDAQACIAWLEHRRDRSMPRILLLNRKKDPALNDAAMTLGIHGVLDHNATINQLLTAIEKVHQGEVWLDHGTSSRLLQVLAQREQEPVDLAIQLLSSLTPRERRILDRVLRAQGEPVKSIAAELFISESTLRNHLTSIYQKTGVRNRYGLIAMAAQAGLSQHLFQLFLPERPNSSAQHFPVQALPARQFKLNHDSGHVP